MRLVNTKTLHLDEFHGSAVPPYAILSHTWTASELNLQDWLYAHGQNPPRWGWVHLDSEVFKVKASEGYRKVLQACDMALKDGLAWLWADTVCIDKTSSAELSEAINSMYDWYSLAIVCYAFLEDVPPSTAEECSRDGSRFRASRWFTRGWTLQELLAPSKLQFISSSWTPICEKAEVGTVIEQVTGIPPKFLSMSHSPQSASGGISNMMAWACGRQTTRDEDVAYSLMGLFGVNMPLLYGEKRRAFRRLQLEVLQTTTDWSVLAWDRPQTPAGKQDRETWVLEPVETLAVEPGDFRHSHRTYYTYEGVASGHKAPILKVSSLGLELKLHMVATMCPLLWFAMLPLAQSDRMLWMPLWGDRRDGFRRIAFPSITFSVHHNEGFPLRQDVVLPLYDKRDMAPSLFRLQRSPLRLSGISRTSILFTWPYSPGNHKIKQLFPDHLNKRPGHASPFLVDKTILYLQFSDFLRRVAYGAVEVDTPAGSRNLFFAVEFDRAYGLRPRRWACIPVRHAERGENLEAVATAMVRALPETGLEEFGTYCSTGGLGVTLDSCAFDPATKEYILHHEAGSTLPEAVDHISNKGYGETFIVAQFNEIKPSSPL